MPFRASHLVIAVFTATFSLSAAADTESLRAQGKAALALNDCTAMGKASRLLAPAAEQDADSVEAVLRARLTDAMLALPGCGESRFQLLRSRSLGGGAGLRRNGGRARR